MRKALFIIGLLSSLNFISAQKLSFEYLGVNEGLSQNSVTSLVQDSIGRIWIATRDGLNMYDGNKISTFRPIRGDSTSLLGHFLTNLYAHQEFIWVTSKNGISKLNMKTLKFERFPSLGYTSVIQYKNQTLVGSDNGLYYLDTLSNKFKEASHILKDKLSVDRLYSDKSGILWICCEEGLYAFYPDKEVTRKVLDVHATCTFTDNKKQIWVGTRYNGAYLLNHDNKVVKHYMQSSSINSIAHNFVRDINEDVYGNIWIGTFLGLSVINPGLNSIQNYSANKFENNSLSHNSIYSIMRDKQGSMWVGTYFGGISYFNSEFDLYKKYEVLSEKNINGTGFEVIGEIIEDKDKNLWIATEGGGVDYFNRQTNSFRHYFHQEGKNSISHNNVKALLLTTNNSLLIGTHHGGLNILNIATKRVKSFMHNPKDSSSIPSDIVNDIIPYYNNYLLATHKGIVEFNPVTQQFSHLIKGTDMYGLNQKHIICLNEDSFGRLWIGTESHGLYSFDKETREIARYQRSPNDFSSLGGNNISCIYEDHHFRLWIGTQGGGLNLYNRDQDNFTNYNMAQNGLPSDFIQGIKESNYGSLWIATSKGLSRLDINSNNIFNYSQKDGFPLNEINLASLFLTSDGEIFVGGLNGLISFNESRLLTRTNQFNVILTGLYVNNKKVTPFDNTGILKKDLAYTNNIELKPGHNVFTINFSANNYISTNQNSFQYKLENFNEDWVNSNGNNNVTYTNLNPGTYQLMLRGISSIENTVIDEKTLTIVVEPPLYRTWYAIVFYGIVLLIGTGWLNYMYRARITLVNKVKAEQREKEQIKTLNQSKLNFFTNISHEFRTPLTLITGTLESIMEDSKTRPENHQKLSKTYHNAVRLNNLITELLDFRKLEHGHLKLKVNEIKLNEFMQEVYQSFTGYAQRHKVNFQYHQPVSDITLWFDVAQMEKVFYNLISNALKFVKDGEGNIFIKIQEASSHVDILLQDDGTGMSEEETQRIFDMYYQIDNMQTPSKGPGTGIGLALCKSIMQEHHGEILVSSQLNKGTLFTIRLLKGNRHFKELNLADSSEPIEFEINNRVSDSLKEEKELESMVSGNAPTVLIVEDNKEVQQLLKDLLSPSYQILMAKDGKEGLDMAIEKQPDLVLSDVMMPNMSGTDMCATLKRNFQTSHIPIILLTARASVDYKIDGLETGADDYITKPFNTKILKARVKNIIHNRVLMQQKFKEDPRIKIKEVTSSSLDQKLIEQARKVIEKNIDNTEFDVQDFAKAMNLGRTRLYTKIKGVTGQTPNDFILSIRLKKAAELLLENKEDMNISEVAYSVGFSTPRYFSRCFRQHFGVSPSKYGKVETN